MNIKQLSSEGKIAYLIKPILKVLQEAGGQLDRSEIKARIADLDDQIAEFAEYEKKSKKTGNTYKEFNFKFNFAVKDLYFVELLTYNDTSPITLTEKGLYLDVDKLDVEKDIIEVSKKYWEQLSQKNKKSKIADISENEEEMQEEEKIKDDFEEKLLKAIAGMTPKKFEAFSRALLNQMGVEFTEKGVQISNDGGIDGYGYHTDANDFRTTRVVIQCKRYNVVPVPKPEMNWKGCSAVASSTNSSFPFSMTYNLYATVMYLFSIFLLYVMNEYFFLRCKDNANRAQKQIYLVMPRCRLSSLRLQR